MFQFPGFASFRIPCLQHGGLPHSDICGSQDICSSPQLNAAYRDWETKKGMIPWWSLHWPRYPGLFDAPKIVLRQTANSLYATIDRVGYYCLNSIIIVKPKSPDLILYYLGLLNSKLIRWLYGNLTQEQNRTFAEVKPINLRKLPIRIIDFSNSIDVKHLTVS